MTRQELLNAYSECLRKSFRNVMEAVNDAEDEVVNPTRYWKASDTLNRLLITLRRIDAGVCSHYRALVVELNKLDEQKKKEQVKPEVDNNQRERLHRRKEVLHPNPLDKPEVDSSQMDRFDRREEILHPDPLDKGTWSF